MPAYFDGDLKDLFERGPAPEGARWEPAELNGIAHLFEHMAFKGTHERSCQQINLDAERLTAYEAGYRGQFGGALSSVSVMANALLLKRWRPS